MTHATAARVPAASGPMGTSAPAHWPCCALEGAASASRASRASARTRGHAGGMLMETPERPPRIRDLGRRATRPSVRWVFDRRAESGGGRVPTVRPWWSACPRSWRSAVAASRWRPATRCSTTTSSRSTGVRAPAGLLRPDRLGRRRPLRRALLPRVRAGAVRAEPPLAVPPRPRGGGRRPRRRTCSPRTSSTSAAAASCRCWASGARTGSTPSWPRRWRRGIVLCGLSAGSLCWFSEAVTAFHGAPRRVHGPRACCRTPTACTTTASRAARRRTAASSATACARATPPTTARRCTSWARTSQRVVASRPGRAAYRVAASDGRVVESSRCRRRPPRRVRLPAQWPRDGRTILAMGGGGFTAEPGDAGARRARPRSSPARPVPRILFLPTASGDPREQIGRFHAAFGDRAVRARRAVALPPRPTSAARCATIVLGQDVIYVGGGSMRNLLALWREHGLDRPPARGVGPRRRAGGPERRGDVLVRRAA